MGKKGGYSQWLGRSGVGNGGGELTLKRQMGMDWRTVEWAITGELEICSLVCHSFVIVIMRLCFVIVHTYFFNVWR